MIRHLASFLYKCPLSEIYNNLQSILDITKHTINYTMCYKPHVTIIAASCVTQNEYGTRWLFQS